MSKKLNIYYLASGKIAVPVLAALLAGDKINVAGIGTQLDRRAGRNKKFTPTAVGEYCAKNNIEAEKIASVNDPKFLERLKQMHVDMIVVLSFGQILKPPILELPPLGCINIHGSLLPRYRGASPVAEAILNGDEVSGVTFMHMDAGLDTGAIYSKYPLELPGHEYADDLEAELGSLAAENVESALLDIVSGRTKAVEQDKSKADVTCKISKAQGKIDWNAPAAQIERMVRAYHPWPGAYFEIGEGKKLRHLTITAAKVHGDMSDEPSTILQADKKGFIIACGKGALEIIRLIPAGKKEMSAGDFLNGYHVETSRVS